MMDHNRHPSLAKNKSIPNAPMSPSSASPIASPRVRKQDFGDSVKKTIRDGGRHKQILECPYSPLTAGYSATSDCTLTPPVKPSQSLVVAAKRHSNAIREANDSKRRRWRRQQCFKNDEFCSILLRATPKPSISSSVVKDDKFAWNGANVAAATAFSMNEKLRVSDEQAKMISPKEKTQKYWEWCYGVGTTSNKPITSNSFSAKRVPPSKGW
jgi:hypothetical protein